MYYDRTVPKGRLTSNLGVSHQSGQFREAWSELTRSEGGGDWFTQWEKGRPAVDSCDPSQKHL